MNQPHRVNEIQLSYQYHISPAEMPIVTKASQAYHIFLSAWDENRIDLLEQTKVMLLNRANRVLGLYHLCTGGVTSASIDPRLIFVAALKTNATGVILAHNHPSGNLKPSAADIALTTKLESGCRLLDITMNDHLIVTREGFYSFAEQTAYQKTEKHLSVCYEPFTI